MANAYAQIREMGVPVSGRTVYLYNRSTGALLGSAVSDVNGNVVISAGAVSPVFMVALDSPYNAIVIDNIVPY